MAPDAIGAFKYDGSKDTARKLIALLIARKVTLVATPPATEPYEPTPDELSMLSPDQRGRYNEFTQNPPPWLPQKVAMASWNAAHLVFERDFVAAGGQLLIGADASDFGVVPGYANHNAIIALVRAGFAPLDVIRLATSDAADFLGLGDQTGTVAVNRAADLLIVKGVPDRRIEIFATLSMCLRMALRTTQLNCGPLQRVCWASIEASGYGRFRPIADIDLRANSTA